MPDPAGLIEGFERRRTPGHQVEIDALVGGSGPPLLLLHGYPQTRLVWKCIAPRLASHFTLVMPDLRGYGRSAKPEGDPEHTRYAKRTMALDQVATMRALGFERFSVAGHDRGARVAYRLALDHPESVDRLAVLDIIPTAEVWARATAESAVAGYHWYLLTQPTPLPERLIGGDPEAFLRWTLSSWAGKGFVFDPDALADYIACFAEPACIHATCEDYRAGWTVDRACDEAGRGRKIEAPLLVIWGEQYGVSKARPVETWRGWARDVRGQGVPGGHFVAEEAPDAVSVALEDFFS